MLKHLLFDMDNTLVQTNKVEKAFQDAAKHYGASNQKAQQIVEQHSGNSTFGLFKGLGLNNHQAFHANQLFINKAPSFNHKTIQGAEQLVDWATSKGIDLFLNTKTHPCIAEQVQPKNPWATKLQIVTQDNQPAKCPHLSQYINSPEWVLGCATISDGQDDIVISRKHNIPIRIGLITFSGSDHLLKTAGATHLVKNLFEAKTVLQTY